jgi:hypothetical protein
MPKAAAAPKALLTKLRRVGVVDVTESGRSLSECFVVMAIKRRFGSDELR